MAKLAFLSLHNTENVPHSLRQEMAECAGKMATAIEKILLEIDPNIAMGAIGWLHASILSELISDTPGELEKGAKLAAFCLIKDIEIIIRLKNKEKNGK